MLSGWSNDERGSGREVSRAGASAQNHASQDAAADGGGWRGGLEPVTRTSLTFPGERFVGLLVALYVVVGRWSPVRLFGENDTQILLEPRFWVVLALVVLSAMPVRLSVRAPSALSAFNPAGSYVFFALVLLVYMLLTALWSPDEAEAAAKAWEVVLVFAATASISRLLWRLNGQVVLDAFWKWILLTTGLLAVTASPSMWGTRLAALSGGPNVFGRLMALLCILGLTRLIRSARAWAWYAVGGNDLTGGGHRVGVSDLSFPGREARRDRGRMRDDCLHCLAVHADGCYDITGG